MKITKSQLKRIIKEEFKAAMAEGDRGSRIQWTNYDRSPSGTGWRDDVYNAEDEKSIQQALGPEYYVVKYQYGVSGEAGPEMQETARQEFRKYVQRPTSGPNGEIVVMPQKTLENEGGRVHYFKRAHDRDEDGNMYAELAT